MYTHQALLDLLLENQHLTLYSLLKMKVSVGDLVILEPTYLENTTPGHSKFWEVIIKDNTYVAYYGVIGSKGQSSTKSFPTMLNASKAAASKIDEKLKGGYIRARRPASRKEIISQDSMIVLEVKGSFAKCLTPSGTCEFFAKDLTVIEHLNEE